jgi:hypothetical protein
MLLRVAFADFGMQMLDVGMCALTLLAVIGCYPANVGWLSIILFMIGLLLYQFSTV